jgi:hypothetical protein
MKALSDLESKVEMRLVECDAVRARAAIEALVDLILDAQGQRAARARAERRSDFAESSKGALDNRETCGMLTLPRHVVRTS